MHGPLNAKNNETETINTHIGSVQNDVNISNYKPSDWAEIS
jgi:hypothetical protein